MKANHTPAPDSVAYGFLLKTLPGFKPDDTLIVYNYFKGETKEFARQSCNGAIKGVPFFPLQESGCLWFVGLKGQSKLAEFIFNPKEYMIVTIDPEGISNGSVTISGSPENVCHSDLQKINRVYDRFLDSLFNAYLKLSPVSPTYYSECHRIDSLYELVAREKNGRLTYLQLAYPRTFTAGELVLFSLIPVATPGERKNGETPYAFRLRNYLKYPRASVHVFQHYMIEHFLTRYLIQVSVVNDTSALEAVKAIMEKFNDEEEEVDQYIADFLVKSLLNSEMPALALEVRKNQHPGCALRADSAALPGYIFHLANCKPGMKAADILAHDLTKKPVSLSSQCTKSDFTLLVFWTADCRQGFETLESLNTWLNKQNGRVKGFSVYVGDNADKWRNQAGLWGNTRHWTHVSDLKNTGHSVGRTEYVVNRVPMIFLINKQQMLQCVDCDVQDLNKYVTK